MYLILLGAEGKDFTMANIVTEGDGSELTQAS